MGSVLAASWPDLPLEGPVTVDGLKDQLSITDDVDDQFIERVVLAVNVKIKRWPVSAMASQPGVPEGDRKWPGDIAEGAMMLAVRLYRRRNSPSGVESFGAEGAMYVVRHDPDIAMLLEIGNHAPPQVG